MTYRLATKSDKDFLEQLFCEIALEEAQYLITTDIKVMKNKRAINEHLANWGEKSGDLGMILENRAGESIGAAWVREWVHPNRQPYNRENIPEMHVAIVDKYRGFGMGKRLLEQLMQACQDQGIESATFAIESNSSVINFFADFDCELYDDHETELVYLLKF